MFEHWVQSNLINSRRFMAAIWSCKAPLESVQHDNLIQGESRRLVESMTRGDIGEAVITRNGKHYRWVLQEVVNEGTEEIFATPTMYHPNQQSVIGEGAEEITCTVT